MTEKTTIFIGIDVSKATLDISMNGKYFKIDNDIKAITSFIKSEISTVKANSVFACLEATGGYEKVALQCFHEANIAIHKAHPNRVHAFAKFAGYFAKTDKLDSKLLEKYAMYIAEETKGDQQVSKAVIELQELCSIERKLANDLHAVQCRLHTIKGGGTKYLNKQIAFITKQLKLIREEIKNLIDTDDDLNQKKKSLVANQK